MLWCRSFPSLACSLYEVSPFAAHVEGAARGTLFFSVFTCSSRWRTSYGVFLCISACVSVSACVSASSLCMHVCAYVCAFLISLLHLHRPSSSLLPVPALLLFIPRIYHVDTHVRRRGCERNRDARGTMGQMRGQGCRGGGLMHSAVVPPLHVSPLLRPSD